MAVTVLDTVNNQWYVQRKDGELEPCHNAATAKTLCRRYDEEEKREHQKLDWHAEALGLQLQQVSV